MSKLIVDQFSVVADVIKIWKLQSRNMNFSDSILHRAKSSLHVSLNEYTWFLYIFPANESQTLSSRDTALTPLRMLLTGSARPHPSRLLLIADLKEIRSLCIVYERRDCSTTSERSRNACCLQCRGSVRAARTAHDEVTRLAIGSFYIFTRYKDDERFFMAVDCYRR